MTPHHELASTASSEADQTDRALMARVRDGDSVAFSALVELHSAPIYRVAYRMLGDGHEAEDIVQDVFTRLWTHAPQWKPSGAGLGAWLHRVGVNLCLDRLRKRKRIAPVEPPESTDDTPRADKVMVSDEIGASVDRCLRQLPDRQAAALILSYYEGLSNSASAEILELNIKALESLLVRARRKMRALLEQEGVLATDVEQLT
ncbi:RNA polymerase sigma factor [Parasphingopyxis algicola]|uniref:RNA polymerase sigma factor n=1 Tax=Parasphingopyxis algicola TaxID=2026624 RepID=UPI0015A43148|nr:RNA polymerase sigma factor [Parasphingopyxis algicola]QLC23955.1 RNA polymerase sigma factor [Parasphingopyxis algicola]